MSGDKFSKNIRGLLKA